MRKTMLNSYGSEKGQSLILVVASAVGLMAILALTLDGGFALMRRRSAQNSADAGALAGARELCETGSPTAAREKAQQYAVTYNTADSAWVESLDGIVTVDATATYNSFFAGIFGISEINVTARAKAGCFSPGFGNGILPIAWSCNPPVSDGTATPDASYHFGDCEVDSIDPLTLQIRRGSTEASIAAFHATWYPELYVIMDSGKTGDADIMCLPEVGGINCDLDGNGTNDLLADGDRSWLDLDGGGGGASELADWISGAEIVDLNIHTWLPGQQGVTNHVFSVTTLRVGDIVVVPVFDAICESTPEDQPGCYLIAHGVYDPLGDITIPSGGTFTSYFHIIGFAAFYISCVDSASSGPCPGHTLAVDLGIFSNEEKTIEGYFLNKGFVQGISGQPSDGVDAGIYTVYLVE